MSELPDTWTSTSLKTVANLVTGNTPSTKSPEYYGGNVPFVKPGDLDGVDPIATTEQQLTELGAQQSRLVRAGATLVSCIGNLGKVGFAGVPLATNQQINTAEFHSEIVEDRYGYYLCKTLKPWMERESSATTIAILNKGKFGEAPFPLAPLAEQKRIADKLDTVLARVDAVNTRLTRIAPVLKRFRQSVLAAAISGRLTDDWRIARGLKHGAETTLQAICLPGRVITYGVVKLGDETPGGTPCLRTSNVRWLRFELDGMKLIDPNLLAGYGRTVLRGGEVLVNVRGTLGGVAVATDDMAGWNVSREVAVVPVDQTLASSAYISLWIASDECQRWLTSVTKGVAYTGINIEDLRTLPLALPLKEEQVEIVRRVETLFAFADRLEARLRTARNATERA